MSSKLRAVWATIGRVAGFDAHPHHAVRVMLRDAWTCMDSAALCSWLSCVGGLQCAAQRCKRRGAECNPGPALRRGVSSVCCG